MKIRQAFISNSSSASFIIAGNKDTEVVVDVRRKVSEISNEEITTQEGLNKYFEYEYGRGFLASKYTYLLFRQCSEALNSGKVIYVGTVCNDAGDLLNEYMYEGQYTVKNGELLS